MRALIVGLDPALLEQAPPSDEVDPDPVTAARVRSSMDDAVAALQGDNIIAEVFLLEGTTRRALGDLAATLTADPPDAVMIGAGVRLEPALSWFLELMVDAVRTTAPSARLCFNEDPEAMATAVLRVLRPSSAILPW